MTPAVARLRRFESALRDARRELSVLERDPFSTFNERSRLRQRIVAIAERIPPIRAAAEAERRRRAAR